MRVLALLLALSLQALSLPTRGDSDLQDDPGVPCLNEGDDSDGDDDTVTLNRHQVGKTCFLSCGVVFCEVPPAGLGRAEVECAAGVFAPAADPPAPSLFFVLRC